MSSFYGNGGGKAGGSSDGKPAIIEYGRVVTTEEGTFIELKIQNVLEPLKIEVEKYPDYNSKKY